MGEYICSYRSPLGKITMESDGDNLTGLWLLGQKRSVGLKEIDEENLHVFERTRAWLDCYFGGQCPTFTPPLAAHGSEFCREVWKILCEIPYGGLVTYGDIAKRIAAQRGIKRMSAQAVGGAVGRNPISIIIPCHRVIGAAGNLTGYGGGIEKKVELLKLEGVDVRKLHMPSL